MDRSTRTARLRARLVNVGLAAACAWSFLALLHGPLPGSGALAAALFAALALTWLALARGRRRRLGLALACALVAAAFAAWPPSNERRWVPEHARAPRVELVGGRATVHGVRAFAHRGPDDFDPRWETRTFELADVRTVDLLVATWGRRAVAHTMLSFGFANGEHLCLSVEARREVGERYSGTAGLFHAFELLFVLGDERDLILSRVAHRGEEVHLYPTSAGPEDARRLLERVLHEAETLARHPRWYRTVGSNCTTTLVDLVNEVAPVRIPLARKVLLNGYLPELGREQGWLRPVELTDVGPAARAHGDAPGFSTAVRAALRPR